MNRFSNHSGSVQRQVDGAKEIESMHNLIKNIIDFANYVKENEDTLKKIDRVLGFRLIDTLNVPYEEPKKKRVWEEEEEDKC